MPQAPPAPSALSRISKWWPIGFFIGAVVFFVIGGALIGTYVSNAYSDCYNSYSYNSYYYSDSSCTTGNTGEFYGGVACLVIGGILKLIAWILLIVYCVKRRRSEQTTVVYTSAPMPETISQPFAGQQLYAAPQPAYVPPQPDVPLASPGPIHAEMHNQPLSGAGTPLPKEAVATETAVKYCGQCGVAVTGRFCTQCGVPN